MKPFITPLSREELIENVQEILTDCFKTEDFSGLVEDIEEIRIIALKILLNLPETINSKMIVHRRCATSTDNAEVELGKDYPVSAKRELRLLRSRVCSEVVLILYAEFTDNFIQNAAAHCQSRPTPKKWGMGSISNWVGPKNEPWGRSSYSFWRRNIEKNGDTIFRQRILLNLPKEWQESYDKKSHAWGKMSDDKIATVLKGLQKEKHPARCRWSRSSIKHWKSAHNEPWGRSFYGFWQRRYGKDSDAKFRQHILPHLPERWQKRFETTTHQPCPHEWGKMSDDKIATVLKGLQKRKDPIVNQWGLGSIQYWVGSKNEPLGRYFYHFWRDNIEKNGDIIFRQRILPNLPKGWQKIYKNRSYKKRG